MKYQIRKIEYAPKSFRYEIWYRSRAGWFIDRWTYLTMFRTFQEAEDHIKNIAEYPVNRETTWYDKHGKKDIGGLL